MKKYIYHVYCECKKDNAESSNFFHSCKKIDNTEEYNNLLEVLKIENKFSKLPFIKSLTFLHEVEEENI